jgi:hypothetical protein
MAETDPRAESHHVFHLWDGKDDGIPPIGEAATRLIRGLGEEQHGVVARRQLIEQGLGKGLLQERLRTRLLVPIHRGVYAVGHQRHDLKHRWMAAVLASGSKAALSHRSAAHLWSMRGWHGPIEVTRPSGGTRRAGIRVRQSTLERAEIVRVQGIPVTTVERTLLDIAAELDEPALARCLAAVERSGEISWPALRLIIDSEAGTWGVGRLRRVVSEADPSVLDARSGTEIDFLGLCRWASVTPPGVNTLVEGLLVDFVWPSQRVIVEVDSYRYHQGRRSFQHDSESTLRLEAAGYVVLRVTDVTLERDPRPFFRLLRERLGLPESPFPPQGWKT